MGVSHKAGVGVSISPTDLGVEQLRVDRPADVHQFALLGIDSDDPKLAPPRAQQRVEITPEGVLELLCEVLPYPLTFILHRRPLHISGEEVFIPCRIVHPVGALRMPHLQA